ncbi:MAG: cation transporter [Clostridiales bacterium]|nr:cation transporter [Clostridiales bacterium]
MNNINSERTVVTKKISIIGIVANAFLFILKLIIGIIANSQAMIADGINSAGDIVASLMTYIGNKIASEPSDDNHNYGHGKAEYIFSLFIGLTMVLLSAKVAINAFSSILNYKHFTFSWYLVIVCIITIISKLALYIYSSKLGKKYNSILITANSKDHLNDVFVTISTLISILAGFFNIYILDGIIGMAISILIIYSGIKIIYSSSKILMDESINELNKNEITNIINNYSEIDHIDKITSKPCGNKYIIIVKVSMDGNMTILESHNIVGKVKSELLDLEYIHDVIVHVNPA